MYKLDPFVLIKFKTVIDIHISAFYRNIYSCRKFPVWIARNFIFIQATILCMSSFYAKKSPSFPEMLQIDMISAIYTSSRNIDRFAVHRQIAPRDQSSRERGKAERIGKRGNFSRKLRRTSDNDGREKRGTTFGEKVSDLRASIDVEGYGERGFLYTSEGVASVRIV